GDIYAISFNTLYKYDFTNKMASPVSQLDYGVNALEVVGDYLFIASNLDSNVEIRDLSGVLLAEYNLPGGVSAGDISIIDQSLFRTTANGIFETSLVTGETHMEIGSIGAKYHGLAKSQDNILAGFANDGEVKGYNPAN